MGPSDPLVGAARAWRRALTYNLRAPETAFGRPRSCGLRTRQQRSSIAQLKSTC